MRPHVLAFRIFLTLAAGRWCFGLVARGALGCGPGAAVAAWAWFVGDLSRGARVLRWLRTGDLAYGALHARHVGEAADRARRLLRQSEAKEQDSHSRLQEILAALQATPNGVVLLDSEGHIEWCNQIAASQFGIDAQRDVMQSIGNLVRDPDFSAYYAAHDFSRDVVLQGATASLPGPCAFRCTCIRMATGASCCSRDVTALEQADAMRRDFVANVPRDSHPSDGAHRLHRNPADAAALTRRSGARYLGMMSQQASRMQSVVQDLLTLSRLEGSPLPGMTEWTPVQALMQRCEDEARGCPHCSHRARRARMCWNFRQPNSCVRWERSLAFQQSCKVRCPISSATPFATHLRVAPSPWSGERAHDGRCGFPCATRARALRQSTFRV